MFCTPNYKIVVTDKSDITRIAEIYNSNTSFLVNHIGAENISEAWALKELYDMLENGFSSCKIMDIKSNLTVGFMEFKISEDTYLSLIMIDAGNRGKGIGKEIIQSFEEFAKSRNSKRIRIDVVTGYDESVTGFWLNNGFITEKEIVLSWNGKELPAVKMIKALD